MVIAILLVAFAVEASYNEIVNRVFSFKTLLKRFSHLVSVILSAYILLDGLPHETSMYEGIKKYLSSTYGKHPFNLISMFNPDTGLVAEGFSIKDKTQILNFSITNVSLGMTKGSYEGFSYLGMGCIIIFLLSFVLSLKSIGTKTRVRLSREKLILVFGLALILMFAITYRVCIGSYEYSLPSNVYAQWVLGFLRSSGRFVWPIAYFLIAISLANLYKSKISLCMREKSRLMFLFLVVAFQAIDVTFPLIHRQIVFDFSPSTDFRRDFSSEYVYKTRDYKQIAAWPQGNFIENHYAELNYLAWKAGQVTDLIFTSRINMRAMYRLESKTYRQICSGEMDRNKLYAVSNEYLNRLDNCQGSKKILYKTSTHTYFIGS